MFKGLKVALLNKTKSIPKNKAKDSICNNCKKTDIEKMGHLFNCYLCTYSKTRTQILVLI